MREAAFQFASHRFSLKDAVLNTFSFRGSFGGMVYILRGLDKEIYVPSNQ